MMPRLNEELVLTQLSRAVQRLRAGDNRRVPSGGLLCA
jgi:hypothetical protein